MAAASEAGATIEKPTEVLSPLVPWIYVQNPSRKVASEDEIDDSVKDQIATMMFQEMVGSGKSLTADDIKVIAKQANYVSGKWLVYRSPEYINDAWLKIANATKENKLGCACKVSTAGQVALTPNKMHVICIYTDDYTDAEDCNRVEAGLRELGIGATISYKPDIYTTLGIYAKNPWKIKPTVYTSRKVAQSNESVKCSSSYQPPGSQTYGQSNPVQSNPYFPKTTYLSFDQANMDAILSKIKEFNKNLPSEVQVSESSLASLAEVNTGNLSSNHLGIISSLLKWPQDVVFPCLDILRLVIKQREANEHFYSDTTFLKLLLGELSVPNLKASNQMLILRILVNSFKQPPGEKVLIDNRMDVMTSLSSVVASSNKNVQIALGSLALNFAVACQTNEDLDARSECLQAIAQMQHVVTDPEAHFRLLVALGTLVSQNEESQALAKSLELHTYPIRTSEIKEPIKVAEISKLISSILS